MMAICIQLSCSVLSENDDFGSDSELIGSIPLDANAIQHLTGRYLTTSSSSLFRGQVSVIAANSRLSVLSYDAETYAVFNAGCRNNNLILEGKTHDLASQSSGAMRLRIAANRGGAELCSIPAVTPSVPHVAYTGQYGSSRTELNETITLNFFGPPKSTGSTYIIGHHGCRTVDNCGASENSLEGIKYAGYMGANAVEIDVQLSKDGTAFLYHDEDFNSRLTTGAFCLGNVSNYTMLMIKLFCRLKHEEYIPTLREALTALVKDDTIKMVWLDPKNTGALPQMVALANEFAVTAQNAGKNLEILIGLPDEDYLNAWLAAPGRETTKCVAEYSVDVTLNYGCRAYAPRFTLGPQPADAAQLHSSGKLIFYWTLNDKSFFNDFLVYGGADGIISDRVHLLYTYFQK